MKIVIEAPGDGGEEEIIIRCRSVSQEMMAVIGQLSSLDSRLMASCDGSIFQIDPKDVLYFETVDNKTFAYTQNKVYQVARKLYELEEQYKFTRFARISKSVIVNLNRIDNITPAFNGRFEACMKNGEKIIISRTYVPEFKKQLGMK